MQITRKPVKAFARWLPGGDPQTDRLWAVTHPDCVGTHWTAYPHDTAEMLQKHWRKDEVVIQSQPQ